MTSKHALVYPRVMVITNCRVRCPKCGVIHEEEMPLQAPATEFKCVNCDAVSKPGKGEHCIYCAFGNVICPEQQQKRDCCSGC